MQPESLIPINGTSNYNPSLTHGQSDLDRKTTSSQHQSQQGFEKKQKKDVARKPIPVKLRHASNNILSDSHFFPCIPRLDWLSGIGKINKISLVKQVIKKFLNESLVKSNLPCKQVGQYWFNNIYHSRNGVLFCWRKTSTSELIYYLSIPGKVISKLSLKEQYHLCSELFRSCSFTCNRIDTAIDDPSKSTSRSLLAQALRSGNYKGFKTYSFVGDTVYVGSLNSTKCLRFYPTLHNHGFDADRWELQLRFVKAQTLFTAIANCQFTSEKDIALLLANSFVDSISFINRMNSNGKEEKNRARCKLLPWWKTFTLAVLLSCNAIAP